MGRNLLLASVCSLVLTGCYSKRVEKIERVEPEKVIVHERQPDVVIQEHDPDVVRRETTIIDRD